MKIRSVKTPLALCSAALSLALGMVQPVSAGSVTIADNYVGSDDHGHGDIIGTFGTFDIKEMTVTRAGNTLTVKIDTNFAGKGDDMLFTGLTNKDASKVNGISQGIGYGDLFLSSVWTPYGTAPYKQDDNSNGTKWSYGFSLDNRWMAPGSGTGKLYSLNGATNDANALLSEDFLSGGTFRNGQEVAVDIASATGITGSSSWSVNNSFVTFTIDLTGTTLASSDTIALHWAMTCGNDTIEGAYVPVPAAVWLFGSGLIGLVSVARRKKA